MNRKALVKDLLTLHVCAKQSTLRARLRSRTQTGFLYPERLTDLQDSNDRADAISHDITMSVQYNTVNLHKLWAKFDKKFPKYTKGYLVRNNSAAIVIKINNSIVLYFKIFIKSMVVTVLTYKNHKLISKEVTKIT